MEFSKKAILEADLNILSLSDKKQLLNKYFPESLQPWHIDLGIVWKNLQEDKLWRTYLGQDCFGEFSGEYHFSNNDLILLAEKLGNCAGHLQQKGVRVTDFTKWLMSLYIGKANPSALAYGKHIERSVARMAAPSKKEGWQLVYRDPLETKPTPLKISGLTFNNEPLWGAPDLVYRNTSSGEIVIVERKASDKLMPLDGWPNLRAQLWAYGHIDEFQGAKSITLIGEVWGFVGDELRRRSVIRWSKTNINFDQGCMALFALYGGQRST